MFIDALRGICAILVLLFHLDYHIFIGAPLHPIPRGSFSYYFVAGDFDLGKYAVAVFFLISGFLIPSTLLREKSLARFAVHRIFRLYPVYWTSLLAVTFLPLAFTGHVGVPVMDAIINTTMLQKFVGVPDAIGVYWTLQIEVIFYVICAILFLLNGLEWRVRTVHCMLLLSLITAIGRLASKTELPVAVFIGLSLMFLGDSIRAYFRQSLEWRKLAYLFGWVALCLIPICTVGYGPAGPRYIATYWAAMLTFAAACRFKDLFRNPILLFLGNISYGVYLFGGSLGMWVASYVFSRSGSPLLTIIAALVSTVVIAYLIYITVERPSIQAGKAIGMRFKSAKPLIVASAVG